MRASPTIAVLATALLCVLGASQVKGDGTHACGVLRSDGGLDLCIPTSDCILFMNQPFCMSSEGKYLKGPVGTSCYLIGNPYEPKVNAWNTKTCATECGVQNPRDNVCK